MSDLLLSASLTAYVADLRAGRSDPLAAASDDLVVEPRRPDAAKVLGQVFGGPGLGNRIVDSLGGRRATELELKIELTVHALRGHLGIELESPPIDLDFQVRARGEGPLQPTLADEAPGTDRIGKDIQPHRGPPGALTFR